MKKLLIIKAGKTYASIRKTLGDFEDWITDGIEIPRSDILVYPAYGNSELPELNGASAIIVTGSHAMVTSKSKWISRLSSWLRQKVSGGIPLLGICFGHQIIAQAFGGTVDYHTGGIELGVTSIKLTDEGRNDLLFRTLPSSFPVHVAHSQTVVQLPPGARLLASNDFETNHAFSIGHNIWGVQFHPEFSAEILYKYIKHDKKRLEKDGYDIENVIGSVSDNPYGKIILQRFLDIASTLH
jgi:GMP synthase (glutamine-hydrolysing)